MADAPPFDPSQPFEAVGGGSPLRITVTKGEPPPFDPSQPFETVGAGGDVARSAGSGLAKGVAGLVGLPEALSGLGAAGIDKASQFVAGKLGVDYKRPALLPTFSLPTTEQASKFIEGNVTDPLGLPSPDYQPQTKWGEYAKTAGEFVPGAVLAPGGAVGNAVRYGVVPGLASEAARQATKGSQFEGAAAVGGALVGGGLAGALSRPGTAARALREQMPAGVTPQMVDDAQALIQQGQQQGITLSWPEALSQVANRPVLTNTLRHLEGAPQTEAQMAEFFGQRPQQIEQAGRTALDNVAPVNNAPSTIGPAVGQAAEGVVNGMRKAINNDSQPLYQAAAPQRMDPATMAQITAAPGWEEARNAVRNDGQLNRHVANLPDDSIGFLNEVQKYLGQRAENAAAPVNQARNMQISGGLGMDQRLVRDAATRQSPELAQAIGMEAANRTQYLDPLLHGPLGKLASSDTTTQAAINALFPKKALGNSEQEVHDTVRALAARAPRAAADLVRAHAEMVFNNAKPGISQGAGAKFATDLVSNPQHRANFEAAVTALPNGADRLAGFNRFLDVAEATANRQNIGSRTAYNAERLKNEAGSNLVGDSAKILANPIRGVQPLVERYQQWRLGRNLNELADILTNPQAVNQLRAIARMPANSPAAVNVAARLANIAQASSNRQPTEKTRQ